MAFSSNSVTEVFPNASVAVDGTLSIPSGDINSYAPTDDTTPGVYEMCFGLLDTMAGAVATGNLTNLTVVQGQGLSGSTLTKTYNFTVRLDFNTDTLDEVLDVKSEPSE